MKRKDGAHSGNPAVRKAVAAGEKQHVAWAYQRGSDYGNGRGFGFTGLHFHWNFENDDFRKTVLNGVAWTAGLEIPKGGVPSPTPKTPRPRRRDRAFPEPGSIGRRGGRSRRSPLRLRRVRGRTAR